MVGSVAPFSHFLKCFEYNNCVIAQDCEQVFRSLYTRELASEFQTIFLLALARCFFQYALQSTPVGANYYRLLAPLNFQNFTRALKTAKIMFSEVMT